MAILFYRHLEVPYGCFSNFSKHGFEVNGVWWPTSEHYFQAQKFAGTPHADEVRLAAAPNLAARIGRDASRPLRPDWEQVKDDVMRFAVRRKFEEHADIRTVLLSTGDEEIVENTSKDYYWGRGKRGTGKNMLGRILMEVRAVFREQAAE